MEFKTIGDLKPVASRPEPIKHDILGLKQAEPGSLCKDCGTNCKCELGVCECGDNALNNWEPTDEFVRVPQSQIPEISVSDETLELGDIKIEIFRNRSVMECRIIDRDTGEVIRDRMPVEWASRQNSLDYLSVSKIKAYEDCPACFYRQYMADETKEEDNGNFYTKFGTILHEVVEKASQYYMDNGIIINPLQIYDEVWANYDLTGFEPYLEGKGLIEDYFARNPVDKRTYNTLFVEKEWRGELGGCTFGLMIDFAGIMKSDPTTGILGDYKTNRMPFTPSELDESFQLKVYELVLRRFLAPDVKNWISGYEMFRYGWQQCPTRTEEDLLNAEQYIANTWQQISNDNVWEEKLNNYCGFRKCRFTCKTYQDFVNNPKRYIDMVRTDVMDLSAIEKERQLMTTYEKVAKGRKDDCAAILKAEIENAMKNNQRLIIDGQELQLYSSGKQSYRYYDTKNVLLVNNGLDILDKCLTIGKTKMDAELKKRPELKLALTQCMDTSYASPYIVTKKYNPKK